MKKYIRYIVILCLFPLLWGACDDSDSGDIVTGKAAIAFGTLHLKSFENVTPLLIPVVLSQPAAQDTKVSVEVKSEAGALEGVHYRFRTKELVITRGSSVGYFEVELFDDREVNPDRDFYVELLSAGKVAVEEGKDVCRVTIQSDEGFPTLEFEKTLAAIGEDEGGLSLRVNLGRVSDQKVTFRINVQSQSAEEGIHFVLPEADFTIPAGDTTITIPLTIIDDIDINPDRIFQVELADAVNAVISGSYSACKVTIKNDDTPVYISFAEPARKAFESDRFVDIPVVVEGTMKKPVTFTIKVTDENQTDMDLGHAQLTLPVGRSMDSIRITLNDNGVIDKDRKYTLYLSEVVNAEKASADTTMELTVMNDDLDYGKLYDELLGATWNVEIEGSANAAKTSVATFSGGSNLEEEDQNYRNTFVVKMTKVGQGSHDMTFKFTYDSSTGDVSVLLGVVANDTGIKFGKELYPCRVIMDGGKADALTPIKGRAVGKGYRKLVFDSGTIYAGLYPISGPAMGTRWSYWFSITKLTLTRVE